MKNTLFLNLIQEMENINVEIKNYSKFLKTLSNCSIVAEKEYKIFENNIKKIFEKAEELSYTPQNLDKSEIWNKEAIQNQDKELKETFERLKTSINTDLYILESKLKLKKENLKKFKVMVFGKTKAGKSTIREALTKGDGSTIGKGGQSTTKEVNVYEWKNLLLYDLPGINSSTDTGDLETDLANKTLDECDLVLFVFTSDNQSIEELEALKKIKDRGKEVLVILNYKFDLLNIGLHRYITNTNKLNSVKDEKKIYSVGEFLCEDSLKRIQDYIQEPLEFIVLHAQAAHLYRNEENIQDKIKLSKEYGTKNNFRLISNFTDLRNKITLKIEKNGVAAKIKNFYNPLIEVLEKTNKNIENEILEADTKVRNLNRQYEKTSVNIKKIKDRHKNMIKKKVETALAIDIYGIAESFYNKSKNELEEKLTSELKEGIEKIHYIFEEFLKDYEKEMIILESKYKFYKEINLNISSIENDEFDWKKIMKNTNFLISIISSGLTIFGIISGPIAIGIATLSMGISFLADKLKSKDYKIKEFKEKLTKHHNEIKLEVEREVEKIYLEIYKKIESNLKLFNTYNVEYKKIIKLIEDKNQELLKIKDIFSKQKQSKLD
ncbi:GTPase [Cetobacterium sp.]|uniref:GTPase n=1 Tax=Cetobacterium sp. TaxID=2071632 RepID=UPI003EE52061